MAPKRAFKVGDEVEVAGKASEGFNDSWWQANVRKRLPNGSYEVEYMTLKDDDDETKYSVVRAKASRLRPPLYDDSLEVPFQDREVGQWVDCWTRGGFWTGYVEAVDDEQLTVYFPATYDREVVEEIKHPVDDAQNRVRTCMEWHNGKWLKRAPKPLAGMKNGQPTSSYTLEDASPATTPVASLAGSSVRSEPSMRLDSAEPSSAGDGSILIEPASHGVTGASLLQQHAQADTTTSARPGGAAGFAAGGSAGALQAHQRVTAVGQPKRRRQLQMSSSDESSSSESEATSGEDVPAAKRQRPLQLHKGHTQAGISNTGHAARPASIPSQMRQAESSNRSGTSDDRSTVEANEHLSRTSAAASIKPSKRVARAGSDNSKQPHATAKHKAKAVDARRQPMRSLSATEARDKSKVHPLAETQGKSKLPKTLRKTASLQPRVESAKAAANGPAGSAGSKAGSRAGAEVATDDDIVPVADMTDTDPWAADKDIKTMALVLKKYGKDYSMLAKYLPHRTVGVLRNFFWGGEVKLWQEVLLRCGCTEQDLKTRSASASSAPQHAAGHLTSGQAAGRGRGRGRMVPPPRKGSASQAPGPRPSAASRSKPSADLLSNKQKILELARSAATPAELHLGATQAPAAASSGAPVKGAAHAGVMLHAGKQAFQGPPLHVKQPLSPSDLRDGQHPAASRPLQRAASKQRSVAPQSVHQPAVGTAAAPLGCSSAGQGPQHSAQPGAEDAPGSQQPGITAIGSKLSSSSKVIVPAHSHHTEQNWHPSTSSHHGQSESNDQLHSTKKPGHSPAGDSATAAAAAAAVENKLFGGVTAMPVPSAPVSVQTTSSGQIAVRTSSEKDAAAVGPKQPSSTRVVVGSALTHPSSLADSRQRVPTVELPASPRHLDSHASADLAAPRAQRPAVQHPAHLADPRLSAAALYEEEMRRVRLPLPLPAFCEEADMMGETATAAHPAAAVHVAVVQSASEIASPDSAPPSFDTKVACSDGKHSARSAAMSQEASKACQAVVQAAVLEPSQPPPADPKLCNQDAGSAQYAAQPDKGQPLPLPPPPPLNSAMAMKEAQADRSLLPASVTQSMEAHTAAPATRQGQQPAATSPSPATSSPQAVASGGLITPPTSLDVVAAQDGTSGQEPAAPEAAQPAAEEADAGLKRRDDALLAFEQGGVETHASSAAVPAPPSPTPTLATAPAGCQQEAPAALPLPGPPPADQLMAPANVAFPSDPVPFRPSKRARRPVSPEILGEACGRVLCMDFIGGGIRSSQLKQALSELGVHVQDAEVVNIKLDSGPGRVAEARCGWACLHFRTQEEATDALTGLQSVYMVTDSSPVPRPVLVHWPYWQHRPWGLRGSPFAGHVPDIPTLAHFAQANSLEYELALEWRRLQWTLRDAKLELQKDHTAELAAVMADYKEAVAASKQAAAAGQADAGSKPAEAPTAAPPPPRMSACLWLRGLPDSVSQEVLKRAFAQWLDAPQPLLIEDPATLQARGHAVVRMNSSRHAKQLEDDISTMVFLLGGTPRPVEAATACPGPPSGSLRVYDDALRQTFGSDDHKPLRSVRLVQIEVARSAEEECALRLRAIMERHTLDRAHLRKLANEYRGELHGRHEERIDEEFRKLISLRKMNKQLAGRINQANNNRRKQAPIKLPTRYHRTLGLHVI